MGNIISIDACHDSRVAYIVELDSDVPGHGNPALPVVILGTRQPTVAEVTDFIRREYPALSSYFVTNVWEGSKAVAEMFLTAGSIDNLPVFGPIEDDESFK